MTMIRKIIAALILTAIFSGLLGITGCEDNTDQVKFEKTITSAYERNSLQETYLFPHENGKFSVQAKNPESLPLKTTYLWTTIQTDGSNIIEEIPVVDEQQQSTTSFEINFKDEGKYIVRCDLYDTEDYKIHLNAASRLGTIEHKFIVQEIKFEVVSEIIGEGTYRFTPRITNPEILPNLQTDDFRSPDCFEFNFGDTSFKENLISVPNAQDSIVHEFVKEGTYNVAVEYFSYDSERDALSAGNTKLTVKVGGADFWIDTPAQPCAAGQECTFRVMTSGLLPEAPSYEWDFSDSEKVIIPFANEATHAFKEAGRYVIYVEIFESEDEAAPILGSAYIEIEVDNQAGASGINLTLETTREPPYEGGCAIGFIAQPDVDNQQLPENIHWEWEWGDGNKDENTGLPHNNKLYNEKNHIYQIQNTYTVTVKLYDDDSNNLLATAKKDIFINNVNAIQRTIWAKATVYCGYTEQIERLKDGQWVIVSSDRKLFSWIGNNSQGQEETVIWNGDEFSVTWDYISGTKTTTYNISGKIAADATKVETMTASEDSVDTENGNTIKKVLTLTNVPLNKGNCGNNVVFKLWLTGADKFKEYVTHYEYEYQSADSRTTFTGFDWTNQADTQKFEVEFSAMK